MLAQTDQIPSIKLKLADGTNTSLEEIHQTGPVLIDFWALWCAPCLKAMRHLDDLQEKYRDQGLTVLGINSDTERSRSKVRSYIRSKGYGFTVALDPSQESYRRLNGTASHTLCWWTALGKLSTGIPVICREMRKYWRLRYSQFYPLKKGYSNSVQPNRVANNTTYPNFDSCLIKLWTEDLLFSRTNRSIWQRASAFNRNW